MPSTSRYPALIAKLYERMDPCVLCPRHCGARRGRGAAGVCRTANILSVASCAVHTGEEPPISGTRGSGTLFFSNCTLSCVFCQNYPISQLGNGRPYTVDDLAAAMLDLQARGVHNINAVTPSHVVPMLVDALHRARSSGLHLPLVYNCSGYEDVETLRLLEGVVDVYLPDAKYADSGIAARYSGVADYWDVNKAALREMYRQVGALETDQEGIARRGVIIRHLVLPGGISGTEEVMSFIAQELSPLVPVSLMAQYHPAFAANEHPTIARRLTNEEYERAVHAMDRAGLEEGWRQEL